MIEGQKSSSPLCQDNPIKDTGLSFRSISTRLSVLGRADGSCQWRQGDSIVLAAIYGPSTPKRSSNTLYDRASIQLRVIQDINDNTTQNSNLKYHQNPLIIKQHLLSTFKSVILDTLHPYCQIMVIVQIVEDNGSILSCCINAVTMALIDAGIAISGFVSSITLAIHHQDHQNDESVSSILSTSPSPWIIDPDFENEINAHAIMTTAWDHKGKSLFTNYQSHYDPNHQQRSSTIKDTLWSNARQLSKQSAAKVMDFQRQTFEKKVLYDATVRSKSLEEILKTAKNQLEKQSSKVSKDEIKREH